MMMERVLEPEIMDSVDAAIDYDSMDHRTVNQLFVDDLLAFGEIGEEILDLGTGTARIPIEICRRQENVRIIAADLAPSMLDVAKINVELAGFSDRIMLDLIDAKGLTVEEGRFDSTISNSIIHHIPDPRSVIGEATRVTKPGGLIFFRDLMRPQNDERVRELVHFYADGENEHSQKMFYHSLRAALNVDEMRKFVCEWGFDPVTVQATSDRHWTWAVVKSESTET